jgi:ADP-ribosylglycohydrolase
MPSTAEEIPVGPTPDTPSPADRIAGCLLASAAGDALGAPVEFLALGDICGRYGPGGIRDLDRAYGRVGAITDDTQMTLFTADGLLRARVAREEAGPGDDGGAGDPCPFVHRAYLRWLVTQGDAVAAHRRGPDGWLFALDDLHRRRGPGNTCLTALSSGAMGTRDHALNHSKGCGGVMRAAPAGLVSADDPFALGCDIAAITHSHPTGFLAAGALALMVHRILQGDTLPAALRHALHRLAREPDHAETTAALRRAMDLAGEVRGGAEAGEPGESGESGEPGEPAGVEAIGEAVSAETVERLGGGWIAEQALAIAVFCALVHPTDLEAALVLAANHSGDTDSTAAITGNLMGALLGRDAIPARWLEALELRAAIEQLAADLATGYEPTEAWRRRYPPDPQDGADGAAGPAEADGLSS